MWSIRKIFLGLIKVPQSNRFQQVQYKLCSCLQFRTLCVRAKDNVWPTVPYMPSSFCRLPRIFCGILPGVVEQQRSFASKPSFDGLDMSMQNPRIRKYLRHCLAKYEEAQEHLSGPSENRKDSSQHWRQTITGLEPIVSLYLNFLQIENDLKELQKFTLEAHACDDKETVDLAKVEKVNMDTELNLLEQSIFSAVIPSNHSVGGDVILEVGPGVGGQEAMLFASELFEAYQNFAYNHSWEFHVLHEDHGELGGVRKAVASISGVDAYHMLRFEGGVHRVQRIPVTEKSGRVHTSTVTVILMPQPSDIELKISSKDLKVQTTRASGAGGQHVNKTDSAVRLVHLPTGTAVECQADRSQTKNKEAALKMLRSRLYQMQLDQRAKEQRHIRRSQVTTADRADKIRTYNFSHDRITDHRVGVTTYNLSDFMEGGEKMESIIDILQDNERFMLLQEIILEFEANQKKEEKSRKNTSN